MTSSNPEDDASLALHRDYPTLSDELKAWLNNFPEEARFSAVVTAATIQNCLEKESGVLNLNNSGITTLPDAVWKNAKLTQLHLHGNNLTHLPPQIGRLENLTHLVVSMNEISTLPDEIRNLKNLKVLSLHGNRLNTLPAQVKGLKHLIHLDLNKPTPQSAVGPERSLKTELAPFLESLPEGCTVILGEQNPLTPGKTERFKGQKGAEAVILT